MIRGIHATEFYMAGAIAIALVKEGNSWAAACVAIAYILARSYVKARPNGIRNNLF